MPPLRGFLISVNIHFYRDSVPRGLKNGNSLHFWDHIISSQRRTHLFYFKIDPNRLRNFASACDLPNCLNFTVSNTYKFIVQVTRHPLVKWDNGKLLTNFKLV